MTAMEFLAYQSKVAVCLAVLYLFFRVLMGGVRLHALNRCLVLLSMLLSAVLPLVVITVHLDWNSAMPLVAQVRQAAVAAEAGGAAFPWRELLCALYWGGFVAVTVSILMSVLSLLRLIRRCEKVRQDDGTTVVLLDRSIVPMSWMKYVIVSREDYASASSSFILAHEKAHIRLAHSLDLMLADIFTAFQWFNPAAWMMRDDLRAIHEYQADERVLNSGIDVKQYQLILVKKAFALHGRSVANCFNHGKLKKRITIMTLKKSSARYALRALYLVPLVCVGLAANARTVYDLPEYSADGDEPQITGSYVVNGTVSIDGDLSEILDEVKIYINGNLVSPEVFKALDVEDIASVNVVKSDEGNSAIYIYTKDADKPLSEVDIKVIGVASQSKSGADSSDVRIVTMMTEEGTADFKVKPGSDIVQLVSGGEPEIYVDGVKTTAEVFDQLTPGDIVSVLVSKEEGVGRVELTTRRQK